MSTNVRKFKPNHRTAGDKKAEELAISNGVARFDPDKVVVDTDFEVDEFLQWRAEMRRAELEAEKDCRL